MGGEKGSEHQCLEGPAENNRVFRLLPPVPGPVIDSSGCQFLMQLNNCVSWDKSLSLSGTRFPLL